MTEHRIFVLTSHALGDPLTQGLTLYFLEHCIRTGRKFDLVTFESPRYLMTKEDEDLVRQELESKGISWHPMEYVGGSLLSPKRFYSVIKQFIRVRKLIRRTSPVVGLAICAPAGGALHLLTMFSGLPIVVYAFEPHSEMMAELGVWRRSGLRYMITHALERAVARRAAHLLTGTQAMIERLRQMRTKAHLHHVPTGSDEKLFRFSESERARLRTSWEVDNRTVITYVGKFGGLYLGSELISFFGALHRADPTLWFLVLTPNDHKEVASWFEREGISEKHYQLSLTTLQELPAYLSAADMGVVAYADVPARKFCSPTKVGNYLMSGLPFLVQQGTSEDDILVSRYGTGLVVQDFSCDKAEEIASEIRQMMMRDRAELREICRRAGIESRGNGLAIDVLMSALDDVSYSAK